MAIGTGLQRRFKKNKNEIRFSKQKAMVPIKSSALDVTGPTRAGILNYIAEARQELTRP